MRDITKRAGGRGYQRVEWTNFHTRLVNIPDEVGGRTRREKVVKLTELLRKREINSDQVQGTEVQSIDSEASQSGKNKDTVAGDYAGRVVGNGTTENGKGNFLKQDGRKEETSSSLVPASTGDVGTVDIHRGVTDKVTSTSQEKEI